MVSNRAGANLIFGATAAALDRAQLNGRLRADWGVFEIDEASLPKAIDEIQPKAAVVLNLFRDHEGPLEEADDGCRALVGMDLCVGESAVVVDDRVRVVDAVAVLAVLA